MIELAAILCTLIVTTATYAFIHHRSRLNRARIDEKARASAAAYQDLFDRAPEMLALVDPESTLVSQCNNAFALALGLPKDGIIGRPLLERFMPGCTDRAHAVFRSLLRTGIVQGADLEMRDRAGSPIDVLLSASLLKNEEGRTTSARVTCYDISARKRAEDAVRTSEARKTAILEAAMDCIITMDHHGIIVDFNPAAERTFGFSRGQAVGKTVAETIIPERMREHHWRGLRRFHETGKGPLMDQRFEIQALRADGTEVPVEITLTSTRPPGGAPFFVAYLRDITERRKSAAAAAFLVAIVESSQDAIIGADSSGHITTWNHAAERIYGYTAAEVIGRPVSVIVPPTVQHDQAGVFARVLAGERIEHYSTIRLRKDGSTVEISLTLSPIRDAANRIVGVSKIARDASARLDERAPAVAPVSV